jgi:hypothetical protein
MRSPRLMLGGACLSSSCGRVNPVAWHPPYSIRSLAFAAAVVCHCMLAGSSAPPRFGCFTWPMT